MRIAPKRRHAEPTVGSEPRTLFDDAQLVVVDKPAGWLTHADGQGERPDVASFLGAVGVHQRLDIDTTGVLAFSRSADGRARLHAALQGRTGRKIYLAVVDGAPPEARGVLRGPVPRAPGKAAETRYRTLSRGAGFTTLEVRPITGRTHQIRAHLAAAGCPIRGDQLYGDPLVPRAPRCLLHCARFELEDGTVFEAPTPPDMARYTGGTPADARRGLAADTKTSCYRELNGAADGHPGWLVDRYGDWLWVQDGAEGQAGPLPDARGVYGLVAAPDRSRGQQQAPGLLSGEPAPEELRVAEHGIQYQVRLGEQLSTGLFLDQRPQRAWLSQHASGLRVLNTFAHAGGFSVAAALAGAQTVSIDLSKRWLGRIPVMLAANGIDPAKHDTIYGDCFDWIARLAKRGERFDLVILDPPSTSVGRKKKRWSVARDYPELVRLAARLVSPGGALWTATNHRKTSPERFTRLVADGLPSGAFLERICPPAVDYPTDTAFSVKTHVWRMPRR